MRVFIFILFVVFSGLLTLSCRPEPEPCFRLDADTVFVGMSINFENCSEKSERYEWQIEHRDDLLEVETSTTELDEVTPSFTWFVPGTYNVSLMAFSKNDRVSIERSKSIVVYDRCFTCTRNQSNELNDTIQSCSSVTFFNDNLNNFPAYLDSGYTCAVRTFAP